MATERFRLLEPLEFHRAHLNKGVRADGRSMTETRATSLQLGVVSSAQGSAMVKQGATTVMATLRAEIGEPDLLSSPKDGQILVTIEANAPTISEAQADFLSQIETILSEMGRNGVFLPLQSLCLKEGVYCWVLHCHLLCLDMDGALFDTCLAGLVGALSDAAIPSVSFPQESEFTNEELATAALRKRKLRPHLDLAHLLPLQLAQRPTALSFTVYAPKTEASSSLGSVLVDPGLEELTLLDAGLVVVAVGDGDLLCGLHHFALGGQWEPRLLSAGTRERATQLAQRRHTQIRQLTAQAKAAKARGD